MALVIHYEKERHPIRLAFTIVLIGLLVGAGWIGYRWYSTGEVPFDIPVAGANPGIDQSIVSKTQINEYSVPDNYPRYVSIPTLDVGNSRIYPVKLDASNQIKTPSNSNDTSWYEKSATPGSGGVMLMSGHTLGFDSDAALAGLKTLTKGNQIVIERGDGKTFTYQVVENKSMTIDDVARTGMAEMGKSVVTGTEGLNIIAADGKYVPRLGTYDRRIMLRTSLME